MPDVRRGDVVLIAFPFVAAGVAQRKLRPAVIVQADKYNVRRAAVVLAAITSSQTHAALACKVPVAKDSPDGRAAGLRTDSIVDCQTVVTVPRDEIVRRIGAFPPGVLAQIDRALMDALGLPARAGNPGSGRG